MQIYNIYCDESCHLEHDHQQAMVLGAVWCPLDRTPEILARLREIVTQHHMSPRFEVKWGKISPARMDLYLALLDYFFDDDDLYFRALVVPDKSKLQHTTFGQDHDTWYYKMYFDMLKVILSPQAHYRLYLDIKDSRSAAKVRQLHHALANSMYDFQREIIERVQTLRSEDVALLQLTDLLIGAVSYVNRGLSGNAGKEAFIARMRERSGYSLTRTTLLRENKVNLFIWHAARIRE